MDGIEIIIASKRKMAALSRKYGKLLGDKKYKLHEVISFPLNEGMEFPNNHNSLGCVVVLEGLSKEKTDFLIAHGIEHLNGIHHE